MASLFARFYFGCGLGANHAILPFGQQHLVNKREASLLDVAVARTGIMVAWPILIYEAIHTGQVELVDSDVDAEIAKLKAQLATLKEPETKPEKKWGWGWSASWGQ